MTITTPTILRRSFLTEGANSVTAQPASWVRLPLLAGMAVLAMAGIANASLIAYEPFNYALGAINNGAASTATGTPTATTGGGFTGTWFAGGTGCTIIGGLTYPGLPTKNNALQWSTGVSYQGENLTAAILPSTTPTVYVSFLYKAPSYTAGKTGLALDNGLGANGGLYLGMTASGVFGVAAGDAAAGSPAVTTTPTGAGTLNMAFNTTYFVVVQLDKDAGGTYYKSGNIWINPTPGDAAPATSGTFTGSYTLASKIADFLTLGSVVITDEIRFGTAWADVTSAINPPPPVPTDLGATPGGNSVSLSWTAATGSPISYNVKRSTTSGSGYSTIGATTAPTVTYTDATAVGGTTYYYVVSAVHAAGESANSSEVSAVPTVVAPSAPTGLAATPGNNQVALSWTAPLGATSYNVLRSTTSGSGYSAITTPGAQTTTSYTDATAVNGTPYYYVVQAANSAGTSGNSSQVSATPAAFTGVYEPFSYTTSIPNGTTPTGTGESGTWTCGVTPAITTGLTYTALPTANNAMNVSGGRASVNFTNSLSSGTKWISFLVTAPANANWGGNKNGIYFLNGGTGLWFGYGLNPYSASQSRFGLGSTLTTGTTLQAVTALVNNYLATYSFTYLVAIKIDFNTSGNNDTVTVYINPTANSSVPLVAANMIYSNFDVGTITGIGLNVANGPLTVDEIRTGETYGSVVGYNPPPVAPTGLTATAGVNSVSLSWNAVSGATGYKVLRGTTSGVYPVTNSTASTAYSDITAVGGTTYFYVVQATNTSGASPNSSQVTATPTIALPDVPTGLAATGSNGVVRLSWNLATGAAGYNVKRSLTTGTEVTITNVATTSYTDTGVVNGTPYFYTVSSTNAAGESADSSEATATPNIPPAAPTGLSATAGDNQVALAWTGSAGAASYNIKRSTVSGSGYSTIATTAAPTVAYTDLTAVKFTQYYYVVSAVSAYGESANSSPEANATPTGVYGPSAYEPFDYATGPLADNTPSTASGFTGNWTVPTSANIVGNNLTYPNLATGNKAYQHVATASQNTVNLASSLSSGTKYVSFLFKGGGNSGGDTVGVFLKGNNATSLFAGFRSPVTSTETGFGLGSVSSTSLGGASGLGSVINLNNTATHFIVIKIDFNTSGANDTVSLWINPPAGTIAPGADAGVTVTTFDVGVISAFGINILGSYSAIIDEVRFGDVYGDVVSYQPQTDTTAALASSSNPALPGASVTFTATIASVASGTPSGTVLFSTNGVAATTGNLSGGEATYATTGLAHGSNTVTVAYAGDENFKGSTNSLVQVVNTPPVAADLTLGCALGDSASLQVIGGKHAPTDADGDSLTITAVSAASSGASGFTTTTVTYTANGISGTHTFDYTVADSFGGTDTKTVTVIVSPAGTGANIVPNSLSVDGGTATMQAFGIPGYHYHLQYTPTLTPPSWSDTGSDVQASPSNGTMTLTDPGASGGSRYYRSRYVSGP